MPRKDLTVPSDSPQVVYDMWDAILNDSWMNIVIWGKPRTGKTTLQMKLAYSIYKDWDDVLKSFVYNLAGLLYNMERGIPKQIMTKNKLHNRVPLIMPDDWGAHGNKAKTQHEPAMDIFKGAIDTYGTQFAVLLSSMGSPDSLTLQLQSKYTHEIYVEEKGEAKYDKIDWQQNFAGWQPRRKKSWMDSFDFGNVPRDVYKEYDENRILLVHQLNQQIKDAMVDGESWRLLKRMEQKDVDLLRTIREKGIITWNYVNDHKLNDVVRKCTSRSLVLPVKRADKTTRCYDITDYGLEILKLVETRDIELT